MQEVNKNKNGAACIDCPAALAALDETLVVRVNPGLGMASAIIARVSLTIAIGLKFKAAEGGARTARVTEISVQACINVDLSAPCTGTGKCALHTGVDSHNEGK